MISENIKLYRIKNGLTQKELAERLHVTSQAISRWEKGDVEPSLDTTMEIAKIFEITIDELLNGKSDNEQASNSIENNSTGINNIEKKIADETAKQVVLPEQKPVLAICDKCKRPIFNSEEIVSKVGRKSRYTFNYYICTDCEKKLIEEDFKKRKDFGIKQRQKSFWIGGVIAFINLLFSIISAVTSPESELPLWIAVAILSPILFFTFASCITLRNNIVGSVFSDIYYWGFIKCPTVIYTFDLDGFLFLIGIKILFIIINIILAIICLYLAMFICVPLSLFVYPFALVKSFKSPELAKPKNKYQNN